MGNLGGADLEVPIFFIFLGCNGTEENLPQCPGFGPRTFCNHRDDAYVACQGE